MEDLLASVAVEALFSLSGPVAMGARRWVKARTAIGKPKLGTQAIAAISPVLRDAGLRQVDGIAMMEFLRSPEGLLLGRYVAADVLVDRVFEPSETLTAQAEFLLRLAPHRRDIDAPRVAVAVVESLRHAVQAIVAQVERTSPEDARLLHDIAMRERVARPIHRDSAHLRELWDYEQVDVEQLATRVDEYVRVLRESVSRISMPSLAEEKRVPMGQLYVEPVLQAGDASVGARTRSIGDTLLLSSRVTVQGNPGGGKSTLLRSVAYSIASQYRERSASAVPILITLSRYWRDRQAGKTEGLLDYMAYTARNALHVDLDRTVFSYLMDCGRAVVLLDGMDEILSVHERAQLRDEIEALSDRFTGASFVVTARTVGYSEAPLDPGQWRDSFVQPFDLDQVSRFVGNYAQVFADELGDSNQFADRFLIETERAHDIRTSPLMLGLLCILYGNGRTIPVNQAELYRACADLLFTKWDAKRGIEPVVGDPETAENAVSAIAHKVFSSGLEEFSDSWLRGELESFFVAEQRPSQAAARRFAAEVVELWRGRRWLLIHVGQVEGEDQFRFSHRTFLEFFAAQETAFECPSAEDLWRSIGELVLNRSAVNYCLLATSMHSRRSAGSGSRIIDILSATLQEVTGRAKWNVAAFLAELLPAVRAGAAAKELAAGAVVETLVDLVLLVSEFPRPGDVDRDVFGDYESGRADEHDDDDLLRTPFDQASLPIGSLAGASAATRESLLGVVASTLIRLAGSDGARQLKACRLAWELRVLPSTPSWTELDASRRDAIVETGAQVQDALVNGSCRLPAGTDFWLDLYLARDGVVEVSGLVQQRGLPWLLTGGWAVQLLGGEGGTPLHHFLHRILRQLQAGEFDNPERELAAMHLLLGSKDVRAVVAPQLHDGSTLLASGGSPLFRAEPGLVRSLSRDPIDFDPLTVEARMGMLKSLVALVRSGDGEFVDALERRGAGAVAPALCRLANSLRFFEDPDAVEASAEQAVSGAVPSDYLVSDDVELSGSHRELAMEMLLLVDARP